MSEEEYDGEGNFISKPSNCKECGREIGFRDRKPYDVKFVSENVYRITNAIHWQTCPVKVRQRIYAHCPFCQFESGSSILTVRGLFGYETCEKHSDKDAEFQHHGKTYKYTVDSLYDMYREAINRNRRLTKKAEKPRGNEGLEAFLT